MKVISFFFCLIFCSSLMAAGNDSLVVVARLHEFDSLLPVNRVLAKVKLDLANRYLPGTIPASVKSRVLVSNSKWYIEQGQCDSALFYARMAWQQCAEARSGLLSVRYIGNAFWCAGQPDSALFYYFRVERMARQVGDTAVLAQCYYNIGNQLSELGKFEKAGSYYQLSSRMATAGQNDDLIAQCNKALASNLADRGQVDQALPLMFKTLAYYKKQQRLSEVALLCDNIAFIYEQQKAYTKALAYFTEALQIYTNLGMHDAASREYNNLASIRMNQGKYADAIPLLQNAVGLSGQVSDHYVLPAIYHNLALCYAQTGNFEKAYYYKDIQKDLSDSLRSLEMLKHTERLQEEFEAEKRQLEITNLKQENEVKDLKNKARTRQRDAFMGLAAGLLCVALLVFFYLRQRVRNARQVNEKNILIHQQQMDEVMRKSELQSIHTMLETQEKERKRIAEDLHDRVGSMLSTVRLQFSRFKPAGSEAGNEQFEKVGHLLDETCEEIRQVSHNLVSGVLSTFGLIPALKDLAAALQEGSNLSIHLHHHGMEARMESDTEIHIYRMLQELFNNTIRHAEATEINIDLSRFGYELTLLYSDNGKGFDTATQKQPGIGLRNMYSRVEKLGGSLHIDSGKGNGSTFVFNIPLA